MGLPTVIVPDQYFEEARAAKPSELSDLASDIRSALQAGKRPEEVGSLAASSGWSKEFATWYSFLLDANPDGVNLKLGLVERAQGEKEYVWGGPTTPYILGGLVIKYLGVAFVGNGGGVVGVPMFLGGFILLWIGLANWAEAKGHSRANGAWALLNLLGVAVVASMAEKRPYSDQARSS